MDDTHKTEGARAFDSDVERHACPYEAGTSSFQDWTDGWAQQKASHEQAAQNHGDGRTLVKAG